MTTSEAIEIIKMFRNWNEGQTSVSLAFHGVRTAEDDLLDERRKLLIHAHKVINGSEESQ